MEQGGSGKNYIGRYKKKSSLELQELMWSSQLGLVLMLNTNSFTEPEEQTRPFSDRDGSRQRSEYYVIMSEHGLNMNAVQITKTAKHPPTLASRSAASLPIPVFAYLHFSHLLDKTY